jgi:hypothetical protein
VHAAETALEVVANTIGAVLGLAAVAAVAWVIVAVRRRPPGRRAITAWTVRALLPGQAREIEPPRPVYGPVRDTIRYRRDRTDM